MLPENYFPSEMSYKEFLNGGGRRRWICLGYAGDGCAGVKKRGNPTLSLKNNTGQNVQFVPI